MFGHIMLTRHASGLSGLTQAFRLSVVWRLVQVTGPSVKLTAFERPDDQLMVLVLVIRGRSDAARGAESSGHWKHDQVV